MKYNSRSLQNILRIFSLTFLISSCLYSCSNFDVERERNQTNIGTICLKVKDDDSQEMTTRSFNDASITDMHVLVYNGRGQLVSQKYVTGNSVILTTPAGAGNTIFAIANTGNPTMFSGSTATTISALQSLMTSPINDINQIKQANERLLMSGSLSNVNVLSGSGLQTISGLTVKRLSAKIKVNISTAQGIKILNCSIRNVPKTSYLIHQPNPNEGLSTDLAIGRDGVASWFDNNNININASTYSLEYYMYENRCGGRIPNGGIGDVLNQREKSLFAPSHATYLEIQAQGSGFTSTYKIYLGADNSQNYNVKRNANYTYFIKLNGAMSYDSRVLTSISVTPDNVQESNCYMVAPGKAIRIPIIRANKAIPGSIPDLTRNWDAGLLWTDRSAGLSSSGSIESVIADFANTGIIVKAGSIPGNGVVVVKRLDGTILWSWHIWVTDYNPNAGGKTYAFREFTWMDRNLGAVNANKGDVGALGFFYQWGRKDPFPGPAANVYGTTSSVKIYDANGNELYKGNPNGLRIEQVSQAIPNYLERSIRTPLTFYTGTSANANDWYSAFPNTHNDWLWKTQAGAKNIYDPCPIGWRIVSNSDCWNGLSDSWNGTLIGQDWPIGWFPAAGHPSCGDGSFYVGTGFYWTSTVTNDRARYLDFYQASPPTVTWTFGQGFLERGYGASERCVKE